MFLIVCYDVVADKRRNRLFKRLKGYLEPVQKSVFEGRLPERRLDALRSLILETIDPRVDTVRIYSLCNGCRGLVELIGTAAPVPDPAQDFIV
jgi:CRISPR-associated protein Cas2